MYCLDRTAFKMQTFEEADKQQEYWKNKSSYERLKAAYYLICVAYRLDPNNFPRMDKTAFSMRKHEKI